MSRLCWNHVCDPWATWWDPLLRRGLAPEPLLALRLSERLPSRPRLAPAAALSPPVQEVPARMLYVWGFLGPRVYLDLKSSVRWNEQWRFIIAIKGEGSQKTSEAWKVSEEDWCGMSLALWRQHPDQGILSSADCVRGGWCRGWDMLAVGLSPSNSCCSGLSLWVTHEQDAVHWQGPRTLILPCKHTHTLLFPLLQLVFWAWIQWGNTESGVKVLAIQYILSPVGNLVHAVLGRNDGRKEITEPSWKVQTLSVCGQKLWIFYPVSYAVEILANLR